MSNERDFLFDSNYNSLSNFARIKYGINQPILETELNEMQKIQEDARASLIRQIVPTGFLELQRKDFVGDAIVYNPNNSNNSIAFAPAKLMVNGYELQIEGNDTVNGTSGYVIVDLGDAPYSATQYYDFVYLEFWFEELNSFSNIYKHGNVDGVLIANNMIDGRVQQETSRRVGMRYKIRVANGINIDKWSSGFGYNNPGDYSAVYAAGPKTYGIQNLDYLFITATDSTFKGLPFYGDNGLFVAGRPNSTSNLRSDFGILDDYIFAVPLFAVKRRNQKPYSIDEPNGAPAYFNSYTASERPDGLFYNRIDPRDFKDLRKAISLSQLNTSKLLDDSLKQLLNGSLQTKGKEEVERIQFGIQPLSLSQQNSLGTLALYAPFNKNLTPNFGPVPVTNPSQVQNKYDLAATGYGLVADGTYEVKYRPTDLTGWIQRDAGTVEFFIKPFWDGADGSISQTLFEITDDLDNPIIIFKKDGTNLMLVQKFDATSGSDEINTIIDLTQQDIYYNGIYHIRVTWDRNNNKTSIFINGNEYASGWFLLSALNPTTIKIGKVETIASYFSQKIGCIIDEFTVYNTVLDPTKFPQLQSDIINGYAKIYQSFNGSFRSFKDISHLQSNILTGIVTTNSSTLTLEAPYNSVVGSGNTPIVYNKATGTTYSGSWSGLNTNTATFTLNNSAAFSGETVWVQHDVIVPSGNGIDNLPTKILKAQLNNQEVSFTKSSETSRQVQLINSDYTIEATNTAWDYNAQRGPNDAYARIINYKFSSNGTNTYIIPNTLYGYTVMGVKYVDRALKSISKDSSGNFTIELNDTVIYGDSFNVQIALAGYTFDYESYSKSIVSDMMVAKIVLAKAPGNTDTIVIPTSSDISPSGGVIISFLGISDNELNSTTNKSSDVSLGNVVYYNNQMVKPVSISGIGTPFITVKFDFVPELNVPIEIPVLLTYQPVQTDTLSVWYEYNPYQGLLNNQTLSLSRLTNWKVFSTTLGSGNIVVNNIYDTSINNAVNRLPGGQKFAYLLTGDDIVFEGDTATPNGNLAANKKLVFRNEYTDQIDSNKFDNGFNILNTDLQMAKIYGDHQDSIINTSLLTNTFYLSDTTSAINKYMGAACLVVDDLGNVMLLVVGEIKKDATVNSIVVPVHGDIFKLENSPVILTRKF